MATNSIILLLVLSISCLCSTRDVYIQPSVGEHCTCPRPGICYNITTFGKMADNFSNSFGLVVHFLEGTHLLDLQELVVFTNLTNAVFEGNRTMEQGFHETVWQSTVVIKCTELSSTGIAFVNSSNIIFRYITITNCGAQNNMRCCNKPCEFGVSLGYFYVDDVTIDHVSVQNGTGSGLLIMTEGADLKITNSSFAQNGCGSVPAGVDLCGKNIAILYTDSCNCSSQEQVYKTVITSTNTSLGGSSDNSFPYSGLLIVTYQRTYSIAIVLDSVVAYKNKGIASILIATASVMPTYNLTINNLRISNGTGGMYIITGANNIVNSIFNETSLCSTAHAFSNKSGLVVVITNSTFTYNCQHERIFPMRNAVIVIAHEYFSLVRIESTEISHNVGPGPLFVSSFSYLRQFNVTLFNVTISNNSQLFPYSKFGAGLAAMRAEFASSLVLNNVSITNNNMTGLSVYHSNVIVRSNSTSVFHNNSAGVDGGGLALYADSYLVFEENSTLNFTSNKASHKGGAIFVETSTELSYSPCFFQYSNSTQSQSAKAFFSGNSAGIAGSVLFGGKINDCFLILSDQLYNKSKYFNKTFDYSAQTGPSVISSEPTNVCFCNISGDNNNTQNCNQKLLKKTAYPGEEINISVVAVGQDYGVAPGIIEIQPFYVDETSGHSYLYNTTAEPCTNITLKQVYHVNKIILFSL